jgi:hypothetical protein
MTSSDEEDNLGFNNQDKKFIPLYRKEHGGIVIYD